MQSNTNKQTFASWISPFFKKINKYIKLNIHEQIYYSLSKELYEYFTLCLPRVPNGKGRLVLVSISNISESKIKSLPCGNAEGM